MDELIDLLKREEVRQFIRDNLHADVNQLILNPPAAFRPHIKALAAQIQARQKATGKLDAWAQHMELIMPPALSIEQASSTATCDYKKGLITGKHLIDLTGGMGIDLLALSESFDTATYVERVPELCEVFQYNAKVLRTEIAVVNADASDYLAGIDSKPEETVIYLDPARRDKHKSRVFRIEDCSPNLIELLPLLKEKAQKVWVKFSPLLDTQAILKAIPAIKDIHVISVKNDCKELLLSIDFDFRGPPRIHCVNLESDQPAYRFHLEDERSTQVVFGDTENYLFEPNASVMKAGAFRKIAVDFRLLKMSERTHLYSAIDPVPDFPGRTFRIVAEADKKSLKSYAPDGKINVITRNYPLDANTLKKKWKLKDGGDYFLIAFRNQQEKAKMIIAERVHL